ncbi:hypothetical protein Tco_1522972, partial [Tanacetum coccineum]
YVQPLDDTSANIIHDSSSPADAEIGARSNKTSSGGDMEIVQMTEELGEDVEKQENIKEKKVELDQDQAGSDPDPEPTHNEFMADLYPKVQESLKFPADEHVILEDPLSSTGTLLSMKNLEDSYAIGDQFINDKSTDDEPGKLNIEAEVVFMVTVPIYQASSSVPPLTTESVLAEHVTALEKKLSDLEQNNKNLDNTTRNLGSKVYTLELRDLPHKINEAARENVKEAVQKALHAPLRDRFRDLSEEDIKEMLHQRMFETVSYKSLPKRIVVYEALEVSMECAQRDEFLAEKDKSRKRRRDDQDPPPPLPDLDLSKRRQHDAGASGSSSPQAPQLLAWKNHSRTCLVIPMSHIPDALNNWANALATTYQALVENSLLEKTRDMRTFMNWYCQKIGKIELTQADLEGQAYEVVKPFYPWNIDHL